MTTTVEAIDQVRPGQGPGWHIAADLTPPEVHERRRLRVVRRLALMGLVALLLASGGAFVLAGLQAQRAADSLAQVQARTDELTAAQARYGEVVKTQSSTRAVDAQIATLMKTDVDMATALTQFRSLLPGTMSLTSVGVTLSNPTGPTGTVVPTPATNDGATGATDTAVGTVTLAGTSQQMSDLATYVSNLSTMDGVVDILPASNSSGGGPDAGRSKGVSWTVTLQLTDDIYTHRYDLDADGDR